ELRLLKDIEIDIKDKHVVVIEDILDSGRTLDFIKNLLIRRGPKSLKICVLLKKEDSQRYDINPDFIGFHLNNIHWVGGYGIDYNEKYRNLKNIYEIEHKSI
ncbi:phosphoribosyltransferase family protein, partial [Acinetobacter baumannii]|nr:phosphoribosyltransferase family protein [Acinetobacter baumannii]